MPFDAGRGERKESVIQGHRPFPQATRERFEKLMTLAELSSYSGERANARAAASRLAASHGMSLGELTPAGARVGVPPKPESEPEVDRGSGQWQARRACRSDGEMGKDPRVEALRQYARWRREQREEQQRDDDREALIYCVLPTLFWLVGGEIVLRLLGNLLTAS